MTTQGKRIDEHPDLLRLDALRAGEGTPEELAHVASCSACREELDALRLLAEDVATLQPEAVRVPEAVDRAVLAAFREAAARPKVVPFPARRWLRWAGPALALALAAGVAAVMVLQSPAPQQARSLTPEGGGALAGRPPRVHMPTRSEPAEVVAAKAPSPRGGMAAPAETTATNAEHPVTILDAYRLALRVEEREPAAPGLDANGDGVVDEKDVEAVARLAVALK